MSESQEKYQDIKKGILLLQMGGPENLEEVEPFLYNLFRDKDIIQLPWYIKPFQNIFARFISKARSEKVKKQYQLIGGGSPIKSETEKQAKALELFLNKEEKKNGADEINSSMRDLHKHKVYFSMRYTKPFLEETLSQMEKDEITDLKVIPLYPHYSSATSGSSLNECRELFSKNIFFKNIKIKYIESWYDNEFFIQLIVKKIIEKITEFENEGIKDPKRIHILFSAHGLPENYVKAGDPYEQQILDSVKKIMGRLPLYDFSISYQSKVGPVKWLRPSTEKAIKDLAKKSSVKNLIVVPISFIGDHIETLYEIDILYRELARQSGIRNFKSTSLPKDDPLLIRALVN